MLVHGALLLLALGVIGPLLRQGGAGMLIFARAPMDRRKVLYSATALNQIVLFALPALLAIAVLGRWEALAAPPHEFWPVMAWLSVDSPEGDAGMIPYFLLGIGGGIVIGGAIDLWRKRGGRTPKWRTLGDFGAIQPRVRRELPYAAGISLAAGVCEELFFRLMLPILLTGVGLDIWIATLLSLGLFGLVHLYQKWVGVLATTAVGAMLMAIYLSTGSLLAAMAVTR